MKVIDKAQSQIYQPNQVLFTKTLSWFRISAPCPIPWPLGEPMPYEWHGEAMPATWRRAAKDYRCQGCGGPIRKGEWHAGGMWGHFCEACVTAERTPSQTRKE